MMRGGVHYKFPGGKWREILKGSMNHVEELKWDREGLT